MKIINNFIQGSESWLKFKAGKFSGSEIYKLCGIKGLGETGISYIRKKIGEQMTGKIQEISNFAMARGTELEPEACAYYEYEFDQKIEHAACFVADFSDEVIMSPDGFYRIENKGFIGVEFKCPLNYENHIEYLEIRNDVMLKEFKKEYYWQIMLGMLISDFEFWEFVTYHPDFPKSHRLQSIRIHRDEYDIQFLKARILQAIEIKNTKLKMLNL